MSENETNSLVALKTRLEKAEDEHLQALTEFSLGTYEEMQRVSTGIKKLENRVDDINTDYGAKINALMNTANLGKRGFVILTVLGNTFEPNISAQSMGKLLQIVGVTTKIDRKITPTNSAISDGLATDGYSSITYRYHYVKCKAKIDEWLKAHNHYTEFISYDDPVLLRDFIKTLYEWYVEGEVPTRVRQLKLVPAM